MRNFYALICLGRGGEPSTRMNEPIIVVSGLPRSGTSMMMKMLEAGGINVVTDMIREADTDNPRGYYEFEQAKKIETDVSWLPAMRGKAFKIVSMLLKKLPKGYQYKVIFMCRDMEETLASQARMLERVGKLEGPSDDKMAKHFSRHLSDMETWLAGAENFDVLYIQYSDVIASGKASARRIAEFLDRALDVSAMQKVIDVSLYRNRR